MIVNGSIKDNGFIRTFMVSIGGETSEDSTVVAVSRMITYTSRMCFMNDS
jgi:hypothetical protein